MILLKKCPVCESNKLNLFMICKDFTVSQENFNIVSCETCGFKFTNPMPSKNGIGKYYNSDKYISHTNSKKGLFNFLYQSIRGITIKSKRKLLPRDRQNIHHLDIGCGTGEFLYECKKNGINVFGVEPSKAAAEQAINNFKIEVADSIFSKTFTNKKFDSISMWHVLEHVHDIKKSISKINELLKIGGKIFIALPNHESFDAKYYQEYWAAWDVPIHLWHFSNKNIIELMSNFGFTFKYTKPMIFDSYYVSLLSEEYKNNYKNYIKSFVIGTISNLRAKYIDKQYSSVIYVFEKKA
ncbi:MAG: methyltransferase type 12 [Flavobacteriales bacterium]|nr:methyltransferase type 12 [Flavobacteriales bacterium]|tara:strand:+ start:896 stop:1783 length:888 start_codon:yes stop_codon:yes gene_type:complete